ncbi:MAG: hypothetical protein PVH61_37180 [Candidatus Aminicenantes bacterium]|jgi:hypothetical protein
MKRFIELIFKPVDFLYEKIFLRPKISIKRLYKYLKKVGWNYHKFELKKRSNTISLEMDIKGNFIPVYIILNLSEMALEFVSSAPSMDIPDIPPDANGKIFRFLIEVQRDFPLGRFLYNPDGGALWYSIVFPLAGGTISFQQFRVCMKNVAHSVDVVFPKIQQMLIEHLNKRKSDDPK